MDYFFPFPSLEKKRKYELGPHKSAGIHLKKKDNVERVKPEASKYDKDVFEKNIAQKIEVKTEEQKVCQ